MAPLALFLKCVLQRDLTQAKVSLSSTEGFSAMKSVGVSVLDAGGQRNLLVSGCCRDARGLIRAMSI